MTTIQDVLDAGGEMLPGDPVIHDNTSLTFVGIHPVKHVAMVDLYGSIYRCKPRDAEVYADGINILDINGKLYRVTGHKPRDRDDSGVLNCSAIYEALIPDKPAEPERTCCNCKYFYQPQGVCCIRCSNKNLWELKNASEPKPKVCDKCGAELKGDVK